MIREYKDYVVDILDAIDKAESFVKGINFKHFERDPKTNFAVIRAFEIMEKPLARFLRVSAISINPFHGKKWLE